jgi:RNA polymerase sigma-70 factor (ECF subfamily)
MLAAEGPDRVMDESAADVRRLLQEGRMEEARLALVQATRDSVFRFLRHMLKDDAAVEDIFQDSYLRAFRALELFRGDSSLTTWML